ncbi:glutamine ABC transporter substrate-binding protein/Major cell binding factor [Streptococcus pneumoniae]|nr:glutamine ABC transporter substrate-binding protein/Major cell binding factor [Streptococcus pneumoniae]VIZ67035.1 glutamine ABC transporter substrate-binding protein/Major cell binding factor [Streptococcus pneumoniae]VJG63963.1 glutamine ABC transporter substrate-binding protein/Major cell binding factor [Streptococcus pneumoniae]VJK51462.1 glutamine ABC transporter substrate-binding protein/Major cell binding factor [Streptococcus pneumoniae]VJQ71066.1 glutamine ABC transporter substrate-
MKKKFFLSALLISLFGLAAAKPVQADTSIADIQKKANWLSVSNKTFPILVTKIPRPVLILVSKPTWPRW